MSDEAKLERKNGTVRFAKAPTAMAFGITTLVAFAIYAWTIAPQVTLRYSGIYATAAMYPGPATPPGHPLWAIYGWAAIKLLPFSNIAWRLGVSSALAAALASGIVAVLVSDVGNLVFAKIHGSENLKIYRVVCGVAAGLGFAFDGAVWSQAVIADPWPLTLFLFALTLHFVSRWFFNADARRCIYAAAFVHGLTLTESQALFSATYAFPFLLLFRNRKLGSALLLFFCLCLWAILIPPDPSALFGFYPSEGARRLLTALAITATLSTVALSIVERAFFRETKSVLICAVLFLLGTCACFLLPILSMTNPPVNWGYPRLDEGFFHVLSRGQFDSMNPAMTFSQVLPQIKSYARVAMAEVGPIYLLAAAIPLFLVQSICSKVRRWLLGSFFAWFVMTTITIIGLNADDYRNPEIKALLAASHFFLFLSAGCGAMVLAYRFAGKSNFEDLTQRKRAGESEDGDDGFDDGPGAEGLRHG